MNNENIDNKEINPEGQKIDFFDLIINQRSDIAKIFDKYRNKIRKKRKKKQYKLDDNHLLEVEIIKEREEELNKALRAF